METTFPELTSFGTLLKFALALEEVAAELYRQAFESQRSAPWGAALGASAEKHVRRGQQLEQLRRERLNEVVLQSISGMRREDYLPDLELPVEVDRAFSTLIDLEERSARFFDDAAAVAVDVLGGVERIFKKLARDNRAMSEALPPDPR